MKRFKRIWSDGERSRSRQTARDDCGLGVQHDAIPVKGSTPLFALAIRHWRTLLSAMSGVPAARENA